MRIRPTISTLILIAALASISGCASYDSEGADISSVNASPYGDGEGNTSNAEARLFAHDIKGARAEYEALADISPERSGGPAAGIAVTELLLLPYSSAMTQIITSHLGARNAIDSQGDVLWGEEGLAYFLARGVAWEDSPSTAGIKTLLADRLPWSRQELDSVDGFVSGLNKPVTLLAADLPALAGELASIASNLGIAVADPNFDTFFVPGEVFHDESLDLTLGKSELSLIRGVVKGAEAALYFVAAYDHAWTLERAFGESIWQIVIDDATDPDHIMGATVVDYQVAHLNESLGRAVTSMEYLDDARQATGDALRAFSDALTLGAEQNVETTLDWSTVDGSDRQVAVEFGEFLTALADSTDGEQELPYTEPSQSADLSLLFDGRTIGEEENLLVVATFDDGFGEVQQVEVDEDVVQSFIDGVFVPPFDAEPAPQLTIGEGVETLIDSVSASVSEDFERSVSSAF